MTSLARSMASLRLRAPRIMAVRYNSSKTPETPSSEASSSTPTPQSQAESSTAGGEASKSSTPATEKTKHITSLSPGDISSESLTTSTTLSETAENSTDTSDLPSARVPRSSPSAWPTGFTPWGTTNEAKVENLDKKSLSQISPDESQYPKSHLMLPTQPIPPPPWHKGPIGIHTINYPRPLFPALKKNERPAGILGGSRSEKRSKVLTAVTGMGQDELRALKRCNVDMRYVVNMTKKGKMRSMLVYVIVGDPVKGTVGLGRGRGKTSLKALEEAYYQAVMQLDAVNRYEGRTLWGQGRELRTKFASTEVLLRARPPGHGLQVPQSVHRVLSACGIRDASAKILGSKHPVNVMKAVIQILHGGANPPGFGDGSGAHGKRENKGAAMRSKDEIERARGRYGVDIGLKV